MAPILVGFQIVGLPDLIQIPDLLQTSLFSTVQNPHWILVLQDQHQDYSGSAGRIVDVTDYPEPKPAPKLTKKAVQKLLGTQIAGQGYNSIPLIPEEPVVFGAVSGHPAPFKQPAKPKKSSATVTSNTGVGCNEPDFSAVKKERKQAPAKKKTSVPEFQHQLEGEIRYTFQVMIRCNSRLNRQSCKQVWFMTLVK